MHGNSCCTCNTIFFPFLNNHILALWRFRAFPFDKMASVTEQNSENVSPEELKENKDRELKKHKKKENHNRRPSSGASINSSYREQQLFRV